MTVSSQMAVMEAETAVTTYVVNEAGRVLDVLENRPIVTSVL